VVVTCSGIVPEHARAWAALVEAGGNLRRLAELDATELGLSQQRVKQVAYEVRKRLRAALEEES
jgi:hypothetical protein